MNDIIAGTNSLTFVLTKSYFKVIWNPKKIETYKIHTNSQTNRWTIPNYAIYPRFSKIRA